MIHSDDALFAVTFPHNSSSGAVAGEPRAKSLLGCLRGRILVETRPVNHFCILEDAHDAQFNSGAIDKFYATGSDRMLLLPTTCYTISMCR